MRVSFAQSGLSGGTGIAVVSSTTDGKLCASAEKLDKKTGGAIRRAVRASRFKGDKGQTLNILSPAGTRLERILLVGLGKPADIKELDMQSLGGRIYADTYQGTKGTVAVAVDAVPESKMTAAGMAAQMAYGARLRSYRFDKYKTKPKPSDSPSIKMITFHCIGFSNARSTFRVLDKIADGVFFTRDLVSEPPNVLYPDSFAKQASLLEKLGVKVEVFGERQMLRLGMGALLGVGQGSIRESKMVVMHWSGGAKKTRGKQTDAPIAFLGKGVTFDTGGISIKPSAGMEDMKWDMGGAGVVMGLMKALDGRKAKVNVVGVVGLVENMQDGNAQRPGDIVTSLSGQTIEVLNTDAEGRLVLADILWYTKERLSNASIFDPRILCTGAVV